VTSVRREFLTPRELTERELAVWLGVSQQAVHAWKTKGCPQAEKTRGRTTLYTLADVVAWLVERGKEEERAIAGKGKSRQAEIDLRMSELDLAERELEISEKARQVVPVGDVRRAAEEEAGRVVAVLEQTPLQDAPLVSERTQASLEDARAVLEMVVRRQRLRLAAMREEEDEEDGEPDALALEATA
jgi:phage terminase Nu1 subunit (DNA packaging protein)